MRIAFGPVPSRRLGRSLGINNIPHKFCTYSCVYCQVGRTRSFQSKRRDFYELGSIVKEIREKVVKAQELGETIDYLSFVPDGEPTLDINLEQIIELLKPLEIKIAVITNATLLWHEEVRKALYSADWVSLKVDSVMEATWRRINRPHKDLKLSIVLEGMLKFKQIFQGTLVTETMLVRNLNDGNGNLNAIAAFLGLLEPAIAYLSIPTRPPAESWVLPPDEAAISGAHQIIGEKVAQVEHLIGYEGNAFAFTGDPEQDLLSITAVHPMREDAVKSFLDRAQADRSVVNGLIDRALLVETEYKGQKFYVRKVPRRSTRR